MPVILPQSVRQTVDRSEANMAEAQVKAQDETRETTVQLVQSKFADGIAFLRLNDPPANTYSYEMMQQLDAGILAARMDESVQVIVITGQGEKFFCAGANIQMLSSVTPEFKYYFCLHANETLSRLEQTPKLVSNLCSRRLITRASLRRQTKPRVPWGELSARCRRAPRFPLNRRWRSNANCSSNYFFPQTRKKAWRLTSISVSLSLKGGDVECAGRAQRRRRFGSLPIDSSSGQRRTWALSNNPKRRRRCALPAHSKVCPTNSSKSPKTAASSRSRLTGLSA